MFVVARMPRRGMGKALNSAMEETRHEAAQNRKVDPVQEAAKNAKEYLQYDSVRVHSITGDGRCFFRALAQGMARHQGRRLSLDQEVKDADELRLAVHDALCREPEHALRFNDALEDIKQHERKPMQQYCNQLKLDDFWGGNPEMMVLAKMLHVPIYVYGAGTDYGGNTPDYLNLAKYGEQFHQPGPEQRGRRPVRVLFVGNNHFNLLVPT